MEQSIRYAPIGRVENKFDRGASGDEMRASESRIVLKQELAGGLEGITPGQQLLIVFHFDRSMDYDLSQHPRGDRSRPTRGVFALRSPRRPNPIGITQVEVLEVEGNVLRVHGLDAYNGTPVLDIKPA